MECGSRKMPHGKGICGRARVGATRFVWRAGDEGGTPETAGASGAERSEGFSIDRQAAEAAGYAGKDERQSSVWAGREFAWNASGGCGAAAGVRCKGENF